MKRLRTRIDPTWDALEVGVTVAFSDCDPMRRVWHGHYLRYCELAREAYCAARGIAYATLEAHGCLAPVVRLQVEYLAPAVMGEQLRVHVAHLPASEPGLQLLYEIRGPVGGEDRLRCVAETVQVFMDPRGEPILGDPPLIQAFRDRVGILHAQRRAALGGATPTPGHA